MFCRRVQIAWPAVAAISLLQLASVDVRADELPSPDGDASLLPRADVALIHSLGLMTVMRTTEAAIWPEPFAETDPREWAWHYGEAVRLAPKWDAHQNAFEWDGDAWPINVVGHGVFGSELYFRARACRHSVGDALLFAAGTSAMWEYVFEGNGVRPSGLDLWYTPLAGMVLGELRHAGWRAADRVSSRPWRGVLRFVLDPLGTIERAAGAPC